VDLERTNLFNATNSSLVLSNVQSSQSGNYTVKVSNLVGEVTSDVAVVNILGPASIITQPQSQSIVLGHSATFSVVAAGPSRFLINGSLTPRCSRANRFLFANRLCPNFG
jgi:hypothetical protein